MYNNLKAEMARKNMTVSDVSTKTGIRYQTLAMKIRGESAITIDEAIRIKAALGVSNPIEELFASEV